MFGKLLFFLLLGYIVYRLLAGPKRVPPAARQPRPDAETMVACDRCGLHIPLGESLERGGRRYCCPEHMGSDGGGR